MTLTFSVHNVFTYLIQEASTDYLGAIRLGGPTPPNEGISKEEEEEEE